LDDPVDDLLEKKLEIGCCEIYFKLSTKTDTNRLLVLILTNHLQ